MKTTTTRTMGCALALAFVAGCGEDAEPCVAGPGEICTIVGTDAAGFFGDEGPALQAELYLPQDVATGPDGNVYVTDWNNHKIRRIDARGVITSIAGTGLLGDGPAGPALDAAFNHPTSMTFDATGRMVLAAWHNSRIKIIDLQQGEMEEFCGTGKRAYSGDDGPAETADLDLPASVAYDGDGNLFVMDQANQVIRRIGGDGTISRFAGQCIVETDAVRCAEGQVPEACLNTNKFTCLPAEDATRCSKPCFPSYGGDDGPALQARIAQPLGQRAAPAGRMAFDASGNLFFADTANHRIRRIDTDGVVTTVVGTGEPGFAGDGGPAAEAQLKGPVDIDFGPDGTLYVADTQNSCVRAVDSAGTIRTVAGACGERGFEGDSGPAADSLLDRPYGLSVDRDGNLYIVDTHNHRIRRIPAG